MKTRKVVRFCCEGLPVTNEGQSHGYRLSVGSDTAWMRVCKSWRIGRCICRGSVFKGSRVTVWVAVGSSTATPGTAALIDQFSAQRWQHAMSCVPGGWLPKRELVYFLQYLMVAIFRHISQSSVTMSTFLKHMPLITSFLQFWVTLPSPSPCLSAIKRSTSFLSTLLWLPCVDSSITGETTKYPD